jgi:histone H3/H4
MKKKNSINNRLIIRKNLIAELKKRGIMRVAPGSLVALEEHLAKELSSLIAVLKDELCINARRTLKPSDVQNAIARLGEEEGFWEL